MVVGNNEAFLCVDNNPRPQALCGAFSRGIGDLKKTAKERVF